MNPEQDDTPWVYISALQHFSYCPRQCALIHCEQIFDENLFTLRGSKAHQRVDQHLTTGQSGLRIERALPLFQDELRMVGRADVVEFHDDKRLVPVEYKHGKRHKHIHDDIQLCAQALCLEWMFDMAIPQGAIFHISSKKRRVVDFEQKLRRLTLDTLQGVRSMLQASSLPAPVADARCRHCSLSQTCMPALVAMLQKGGTSA